MLLISLLLGLNSSFSATFDHTDIVHELLTHPLIKVSPRNRQYDTPLHLAAESGSEASVRLLIEAGADLRVQNRQVCAFIFFQSFFWELANLREKSDAKFLQRATPAQVASTKELKSLIESAIFASKLVSHSRPSTASPRI
jgi:ankyrin repeat protein